MSFATLVIGLGGTGVLSLRALKQLWKGLPPAERVPATFLAIDLDRSALEAGDDKGQLGYLDEDEFLYLDPRSIQDALRHLHRTHDDEPAWKNVLEWFPEKVKIPVSEVEANGASQLRVLGRLGFFLHDEAIARALRRKLHEVAGEVDPRRLSEEKRVIIVSSIAGGTGAGMLIDVAYLARRQMGRPRVYAYLLLPEVFQDVDGGGRILQNAYACIQELCHLKDQQIPIQARYFHLPPLDVPVNGEEPFARLFLCPSEGFCGTNPIRAASVRLAESILGQLQRTIQNATLAIVANTVSADPKEEQRRRRLHCFGTTGSQFVELMSLGRLDETVFDATVRALRDPDSLAALFDDQIAATSRQLAERLRGGSPPPAEAKPEPTAGTAEETPTAGEERQLVLSWRGRLERDARSARELLCETLTQKLDLLDETLRALRPADIEEAGKDVAKLGSLVLDDFNEASYDAKLELLREVGATTAATPGEKSRFDRLDERLRDEMRSHVGTAERSLAGGPLAKKAFFEKLLRDPALFRYSFPEGTGSEVKSAAERRDRWRRLWDDQGRVKWYQRRAPKHVIDALFLRRMVADLRAAMADPVFAAHLEAILRVRAVKELRTALERRLKEAQDELPGRAVWNSLPDAEVGAAPAIDSLPEPLRLRVQVLLRAKLPGLLDDAREMANEADPVVRRDRLLELVQSLLREDRELNRNHQVLGIKQEQVETRLREALVRVRQRVFERRTPNVLREGFALIMVPEGLVWSRRGTEVKTRQEDLFKFLAATASQILDSKVQVVSYQGSRIWIYAEDLFNPPDHIRNIDDYFHAYDASEFVELYHIDRRFLAHLEFRDIRTTARTRIATCGNEPAPGEPTCTCNIVALPPEVHTCPGCGKPIRSRCGNPRCAETDLHKKEGRYQKSCPSCGQFNHAAWWTCCRHGEIAEEIPIDKEHCPRCIEEHHRDPLAVPESKIGKRPDLRERLQCPNCRALHARDSRHPVFHLPHELFCFYRDGVNGHDRERFEKLAARAGLPDNVRCPRCRTLLIPVHVTGVHAAGCREEEPCKEA